MRLCLQPGSGHFTYSTFSPTLRLMSSSPPPPWRCLTEIGMDYKFRYFHEVQAPFIPSSRPPSLPVPIRRLGQNPETHRDQANAVVNPGYYSKFKRIARPIPSLRRGSFLLFCMHPENTRCTPSTEISVHALLPSYSRTSSDYLASTSNPTPDTTKAQSPDTSSP
jgi:hypothetical protein